MKLSALFIFGFCVLSLPIASQARDRTELLKLNHDQVELKWEGKAGRTYFIQWSGDLVNWYFFPVIESGNDVEKSFRVTIDDEDVFLRLNYVDKATVDPFNDDFDGDGISNWDEIRDGGISTSPLAFSTAGNGVSDALADADRDGLSNVSELQGETKPNDSDTDKDGLLDGNEFIQSRKALWQDHPDVMLFVSSAL